MCDVMVVRKDGVLGRCGRIANADIQGRADCKSARAGRRDAGAFVLFGKKVGWEGWCIANADIRGGRIANPPERMKNYGIGY